MEDSVKKQITIRIDEKLLDRIKDIVYYSYGMTLSDFVETSLDVAVEGFSHEQYPKRPSSKLKPGRKIECHIVDRYDPTFHLIHSMNQLLESGQMTQEQYDWTYKKFVKEDNKSK